MKLYYSKFSLKTLSALNAKQDLILKNQNIKSNKFIYGLNLKYIFNDTPVYTSVIFHPELDGLTSDQFILNSNMNLPDVVFQNLKAEFGIKKSNKSLFSLIDPKLQTHFTIRALDSAKSALLEVQQKYIKGFKRFKFKMNLSSMLNLESYFEYLKSNSDVEFIFDFNGTANIDNFLKLKIDSNTLKRCFWEDPIEFNFDKWTSLTKAGFRLILDQKVNLSLKNNKFDKLTDNVFEIVSIKPTKENVVQVMDLYPKSKLLITTNMGDEMDHRISAFWANEVFKFYPDRFFGAGLYTRHFFIEGKDINQESYLVKNSFSEMNQSIDAAQNEVLKMSGTNNYGWGLDGDMNTREWLFLKDVNFEF